MRDVKLIARTVGLLFIAILASGCPGGDSPKDGAPQPEEPRPPAPAPPEGTDFNKPGNHGKVGVDPPGNDKPNTDVPVAESDDAGGILGSSYNEQRYWGQIHPFANCPEEPIYVFASGNEKSVAQCADGKGYQGVCDDCEKEAYRRAENVVRSCERAPSCRGSITQVGQQWSCTDVRRYEGEDANGNPIYSKPWWEKNCWTQYKVVCVKN